MKGLIGMINISQTKQSSTDNQSWLSIKSMMHTSMFLQSAIFSTEHTLKMHKERCIIQTQMKILLHIYIKNTTYILYPLRTVHNGNTEHFLYKPKHNYKYRIDYITASNIHCLKQSDFPALTHKGLKNREVE